MTRALTLLAAAGFFLAALTLAACRDIDVIAETYATMAEARQAGALDRGIVPAIVPNGATDILEAHDLKTRRRWGLFNFPASDADTLRAALQPEELSLAGTDSDIPARLEWWPVVLRGTIKQDQVTAAGLVAHRAKDARLVVVVNWKQGRAYYWGH